MEKKYSLYLSTMVILLTSVVVSAQTNLITLTSLPGGSEGSTTFTDTSTLNIDGAGVTTYLNSSTTDDWSVVGSTVSASGALSKTFGVIISGMATTNTTQGDYGNILSSGGIDRASNGALGVLGNSNGIDANEGFLIGLNLTNLGTSASIQITKIYVSQVANANEIGVVVSRLNPSKRITFGSTTTPGVDVSLATGAGAIDISSLNIYLSGGLTTSDLVAVFNNSVGVGDIRITGIELKVLTNNLLMSNITSQAHPRLLMKQGDEALVQTLVNNSPEFNKIHYFIIETADTFLSAPVLVKPAANARLLGTSRQAVQQIFYLSYAYRMTGKLPYLTKAESVINTVCDFDSWNTYSLDTAEMCFAVAIGYDWLFNGLTAATKTNARDAILRYGFLTQKTSAFWDFTSNWNQVCIGGLTYGALAIYGDGTTQMNTESKYVLDRILIKNPNSMNTYANGNYQEGPMYWSYGTTYEVMMLAALEGIYGTNNEGINRLTNSPGFLESAKYMQYVTGPTSLYFNYGDSTEKRMPLPATLWMAKKANDISILSEEKKLMENDRYTSDFNESIFLPITMIFGKDINVDNLPDPQEKLWNGYGDQPVVLVRTDWQGSNGKYTGIKAGTPNYSHSQMDGGTFVYDSQGLRWGMDFGKYDYDAQGTIDDNDFSQNSQRWSIFKVANLSQNTISIKKQTETSWQRHKVTGNATIDEIYDTNAKRGAKANLKSLLGLNNELVAATRSVSLINESFLEVQDYISNGVEPINLYWNMVTRALVSTISPSKIRLTQGGKTVELEIVSSNPAVTFTLATARSTDPVFYNPTATADDKNPGTVMIGFEASIPANNEVTFTVTIKDAAVVPPSIVEPVNNILLELPNPTTGLEGNSLFYDTAELHLDATGNAGVAGYAINYPWNVYGATNIDSAKDSKMFFRWHAMGTTNTTIGIDYGALLTSEGIDRSGDGQLGVRTGGTSNGGIDANEGFKLGLDLSFLPNTVALQLVKVGVNLVTGDRKGVIVNRTDTTKRRTFGGSIATGVDVKPPSGVGFIDVTNLNILLEGGDTNYDIASVFNTGGAGGFRVTKFVFKLIDVSSTTTCTWNGLAWSNITGPNATINAIIAGNYSTSTNGSFISKKLTINSGSLIVNTATTIRVQNAVENNAGVSGLVVESGGSLIQIVDEVNVNKGSVTIKRNSNPLKRFDYTMWSSPVSGSQTLGNFSPLTSSNRFYNYNQTTNLYNLESSANTFATTKGYLIRMPNNGSTGYISGTDLLIYNGTFIGKPNNGPITINGLTGDRFYALGNPYPSIITADLFLSANATTGTLYFWRKTNAALGTAYATYTLAGGVGTSAGNGDVGNPNGTIQVGQGFIVKTGPTTTTLNFNNSMRANTTSTQFFKTKQEVAKDRIWLNLTSASGIFSQALLVFMEGATLGKDDGIDGLYINDSQIALTSNINNEEYTIQGRPIFDSSDVVALNLKTDVSGDYRIAIDHFDGVFAQGQDIFLKDNKTGIETDLKEGAYNFKASQGIDNSRFLLKFQKTLKLTDSEMNDNSINAYAKNGTLYVKSGASAIQTVRVFDLQGRLIAEQKNLKLNTVTISYLNSNQTVIVQVNTEDNKVTNKKVVVSSLD